MVTELLDRLLHRAIVIQIEGASYRLRGHAELIRSAADYRPATTIKPKCDRPRKIPREAH